MCCPDRDPRRCCFSSESRARRIARWIVRARDRAWWAVYVRLNITLIALRLKKPRTSPFISMWPAYTLPDDEETRT